MKTKTPFYFSILFFGLLLILAVVQLFLSKAAPSEILDRIGEYISFLLIFILPLLCLIGGGYDLKKHKGKISKDHRLMIVSITTLSALYLLVLSILASLLSKMNGIL